MKRHLKISEKDVSECVLVCGDWERVEYIASFLKDARKLAHHREYLVYSGYYMYKKITVASHGIGCAGAYICFNELIELGAKVIIRIGTAGGLHDDTTIGDVVIPTGAVRSEGMSKAVIPSEYPAVPDTELTWELIKTAKEKGMNLESGLVLTTDVFYPGFLDNNLEFYKRANVLAVEMECSILFVLGALKKVKTAAILALDGNPLKWDEGHYDPESDELRNATKNNIQLSLDVISKYGE